MIFTAVRYSDGGFVFGGFAAEITHKRGDRQPAAQVSTPS